MKNMKNYDFKLYDKPLKYPAAYDPKTLKPMIPAGATGVEIARGQSSKTFVNKKTGKVENQNVYRWKGIIYNA